MPKYPEKKDKRSTPKGGGKKKTSWSNEDSSAPTHPSTKLATIKVVGKTENQKQYLNAIDSYDMVFGIGPAGSGKTYLAVAKAVQFIAKKGNRLILVRPAVEAGEKLGFLPGSLQEKVDPYMRPIYDALYALMPPEKVDYYVETGIIEIAPLAFMRGRTLSGAFVLLDEAQNTTREQMKMFLTRMGEGSKVVITGDVTQIDLPEKQMSGLIEAHRILQKSKSIHFQTFEDVDIVRHPLVREICEAYDKDRGVRTSPSFKEPEPVPSQPIARL